MEAAENNAQRLARAQLESQTPAGVRKARAAGSSPTKQSPYKTSKRNNNNNKNDEHESFDGAPARFAATVGSSVARPREGAEDSELDNFDKLRVGTAPVYTDRSKFTQPRVVGFGSNSAWSNGEDTAEDSTVAPAPVPVPAHERHNSSEGNLHNTAANPNNPLLTTKQQRLLQAQQSYMKRSAAGATKPSNINITSGTNGNGAGSNNSSTNNLLPIGLKMKPQLSQQGFPGNDDPSTGPVALKPVTGGGFSNRSAPSNHTSEVIKNLAAGKIRIHPVKAPANSNSNITSGMGAMDSRADEMV